MQKNGSLATEAIFKEVVITHNEDLNGLSLHCASGALKSTTRAFLPLWRPQCCSTVLLAPFTEKKMGPIK